MAAPEAAAMTPPVRLNAAPTRKLSKLDGGVQADQRTVAARRRLKNVLFAARTGREQPGHRHRTG
jgi:hypothetical protein